MKVRIIGSTQDRNDFMVELVQDCQFFRLDYSASKKDCEWMAKMFRIALRKHNREVISRAARTKTRGRK
jgi:hypothetical protein